MTTAATRPAGDDYTGDDAVEYSLLERALREADSWRRASFVTFFFAGLLAIGLMIAVTKSKTEAWTYVERADGAIIQVGPAVQNEHPALPGIKHQLIAWITDMRTIPDVRDLELAAKYANDAFYMVAKGSAAFDEQTAYFRSQNPLTLARAGYLRSIVGTPEVTQLTALSFRIAWKESLRHGDNNAVLTDFTGVVTLIAPPKIPDDPIIGSINPAGVYIDGMDMRWGLLSQ